MLQVNFAELDWDLIWKIAATVASVVIVFCLTAKLFYKALCWLVSFIVYALAAIGFLYCSRFVQESGFWDLYDRAYLIIKSTKALATG